MADCQQIIELAGKYLDGEHLSQSEVSLMTEHLGECDKCSSDFSRIKEIAERLKRSLQPTRLTDADKADLKGAIFRELDTPDQK